MKGPQSRRSLDVRRTWECPQCGRILKLDGRSVARRCHCSEAAPWMRLTGEHIPKRVFEALDATSCTPPTPPGPIRQMIDEPDTYPGQHPESEPA